MEFKELLTKAQELISQDTTDGRCTAAQLSTAFGVSAQTVRKLLKAHADDLKAAGLEYINGRKGGLRTMRPKKEKKASKKSLPVVQPNSNASSVN